VTDFVVSLSHYSGGGFCFFLYFFDRRLCVCAHTVAGERPFILGRMLLPTFSFRLFSAFRLAEGALNRAN
jgi:hypothetical protein